MFSSVSVDSARKGFPPYKRYPSLPTDASTSATRTATEFRGRCRFADLPFVQKFTGKATVFMSHCW